MSATVGPVQDTTLLGIVLAGVLPPVTVAAVALGLAWRPWSRTRRTPSRATLWAAPVAIGLGYAAGHAATHGWPRLNAWPRLIFQVPVQDGLFYVALGAALLGLNTAGRRSGMLSTRALASLALPLYLLDFMRRHHWSGAETVLWMAILAGLVLATWSAADGLARCLTGPLLPIAWTLAGTLAAGTLLFSGSASLGQLAGVWTSTLGVAAIVAWRRPEFSLAGGGVGAAWLLYAGLVLAGHYASELSAVAALLLALAPLGAWVGQLGLLRRATHTVRVGVTLAGVALPAAVALWIELQSRPNDPYAGF